MDILKDIQKELPKSVIGSSNFETRVAIGITALLSLIAFQISLPDNLPDVDYLTTFDIVLIVSYLFVFASFFQTVLVFRLTQIGNKERTERIERGSRWLFPLGYFILLTAIAIIRGTY